ncbi:hypothetical protein NDU88_002843 [Pleurodeles waltl]|uniref:Uncharacterized protein n=1 Tax=Pleurodeles waltl TaxID=8319 RepID=A0AAV7T4T8_PLEWA|nr:hypothetical protein NDU88_002843 [Pleurodeles waltl]
MAAAPNRAACSARHQNQSRAHPEGRGANRSAGSWDATGGLSTAHVGSVGPRWTAGGPANEHTGPDDSLTGDGHSGPRERGVPLGPDGSAGGDPRRGWTTQHWRRFSTRPLAAVHRAGGGWRGACDSP